MSGYAYINDRNRVVGFLGDLERRSIRMAILAACAPYGGALVELGCDAAFGARVHVENGVAVRVTEGPEEFLRWKDGLDRYLGRAR